jgi:hypothetical protein
MFLSRSGFEKRTSAISNSTFICINAIETNNKHRRCPLDYNSHIYQITAEGAIRVAYYFPYRAYLAR